ncbi:BamA/TamA family outer membrane protein [Aquiflexum sp. TKW24L]|uniref:BamA/TamA family outer membrane protein n=1 Tax=Aquiflexum sp. TKW24L TaxID=2942212 RepID=UPI0020BF6BD7|nr:BamA/TamA family outer membrane protein [Aquiflexum sp. TKW24L]MCL6259188.1 BamA/TamA family outer membrane protein [Aquiflexum sp. TKW24L]
MKRILIFLFPLFYIFCSSGYSQEGKWLRWELVGELGIQEEEIFRDSAAVSNFIRTKYQELYSLGYLAPREAVIKSTPDSLWLKVDTGQKFEWVALRPGNVDPLLMVKAGVDMKRFSGKPFDYRQVSKLFESLLKESENRGYPFTAIRLDSLERTGNGFSGSLDLDSGPKITFDSLKITGDTKTKPEFLSRFLQIRRGEVFSQKKIDEGIQQIRGLPYLKWAGEPELSFQNEEATLYLPINDRRINSIDGIIGFLPNENEGGKMLVTGQFDIALYNVAGTGRNYELHWQRFNQLSQTLKIAGFEPLLLGSNIDASISFSLLKEDTTFLNRDFRLNFGYRFNSDGYLSFFTRRQAGDLLAVYGLEEITQLPEAGDFRFNNYGLNYRHIWLDDVFFPRRGALAQIEFAIGNKNILQNTGLPPSLYEDIELKTLQYYMEGKLEKHIYFSPRWGIFTRLAGGMVENKNILLNDLFRIGGLQSVRGFNENFFFADKYLYLNFEPRFYFDTYSYFMIFADMGRFGNSIQDLGIDTTFSAGMGLSLETGNGIFNFIYGLGRSNNQDFSLNLSKIHFGYTGRF